ncbi:hypothetical protein [Microlunatus parietis]|uniref:Uncharacterized protein n=1 Tax=Microlunatus parietis TaxID=682979 RepID=A0A7Y9IBH5_9ACTN|nr:hypothetical protein [Microlunatus parietis]NYE73583.1 hypothetical protein [Microlunatus parietis]
MAEMLGAKAITADADIPDDAPEVLKQGLAYRKIVNTGDPCPGCGVRVAPPTRAELRQAQRSRVLIMSDVHHARDCPGSLRGFGGRGE